MHLVGCDSIIKGVRRGRSDDDAITRLTTRGNDKTTEKKVNHTTVVHPSSDLVPYNSPTTINGLLPSRIKVRQNRSVSFSVYHIPFCCEQPSQPLFFPLTTSKNDCQQQVHALSYSTINLLPVPKAHKSLQANMLQRTVSPPPKYKCLLYSCSPMPLCQRHPRPAPHTPLLVQTQRCR